MIPLVQNAQMYTSEVYLSFSSLCYTVQVVSSVRMHIDYISSVESSARDMLDFIDVYLLVSPECGISTLISCKLKRLLKLSIFKHHWGFNAKKCHT